MVPFLIAGHKFNDGYIPKTHNLKCNYAHAHWANEGGAGVGVSPPLQSCAYRDRDEMKKGTSLGVDKKPSGSSGSTWRDKTIYILTAILCVQALLIFVWMPHCWRLRFFGVDPEQSPYTIEETTIGGKLSARNIKNTLTG